jgi:galactokinase
MTGAGFGGCTVSLVKTKDSTLFMKELASIYYKKNGLKADFYQPEIANGAGRLQDSTSSL